jgi:hypothetical protein
MHNLGILEHGASKPHLEPRPYPGYRDWAHWEARAAQCEKHHIKYYQYRDGVRPGFHQGTEIQAIYQPRGGVWSHHL